MSPLGKPELDADVGRIRLDLFSLVERCELLRIDAAPGDSGPNRPIVRRI